MNKLLTECLAAFIWDKEKRRKFRRKHGPADVKILKELTSMKAALLQHSFIGNLSHAIGPLRILQTLGFEVLCEVDSICEKHNIPYWIDSGTLLGAVRYKGFIPWDDDIDIAMMADDYARFQQVVESDEKVSFVFKRLPGYIGKVFHKDFVPQSEQELIESAIWDKHKNLSLWVDIFPTYSLRDSIPTAQAKEEIKNAYSEKDRALEKFGDTIDNLRQVETLVQGYHSHFASPTPTSRVFVGLELVLSHHRPRIFETSAIFPLKKMMFEGREFPVPHNTNKVLYEWYGDFNRIEIFPPHLPFEKLPPQVLDKLLSYPTIEELQCKQ